MKVNLIITLSGRICSGKSFAADLVSKKFGYPVASFGKYLKYYCKSNNFPMDRNTLQEVGENFVKEKPKEFLFNVINYFKDNSDSIIIEGVRHNRILKEINHLANKTITIFMEADQKSRYDRYMKRENYSEDNKSLKQFMDLDNHLVEQEIDSLKHKCNLVLNSTEDYSNKLFDFISTRFNIKYL